MTHRTDYCKTDDTAHPESAAPSKTDFSISLSFAPYGKDFFMAVTEDLKTLEKQLNQPIEERRRQIENSYFDLLGRYAEKHIHIPADDRERVISYLATETRLPDEDLRRYRPSLNREKNYAIARALKLDFPETAELLAFSGLYPTKYKKADRQYFRQMHIDPMSTDGINTTLFQSCLLALVNAHDYSKGCIYDYEVRTALMRFQEDYRRKPHKPEDEKAEKEDYKALFQAVADSAMQIGCDVSGHLSVRNDEFNNEVPGARRGDALKNTYYADRISVFEIGLLCGFDRNEIETLYNSKGFTFSLNRDFDACMLLFLGQVTADPNEDRFSVYKRYCVARDEHSRDFVWNTPAIRSFLGDFDQENRIRRRSAQELAADFAVLFTDEVIQL